MFIYARSEQCDLVPIYTITNKKINTELYSRFLVLRIYPDFPIHTSASTERTQICSAML